MLGPCYVMCNGRKATDLRIEPCKQCHKRLHSTAHPESYNYGVLLSNTNAT